MAVNLRLPAKAPIGSVCTRSSPVVLHRTPVVLARADGPRVTREFKEREDGSLEQVQQSQDASKPQSSQQPLYVDDAAQPPKRKQDNLSKDMKTKLRQEYYGLGGGENKGHLPNPRRTPLVAILTVEERGTETSAPSTSQKPAQPMRSSKWKIDENELLKSTWEHRFWTLAPMAAMAATGVQALTHAHDAGDWAGIAAALAVSYVLSDLGTGIYHWGVDNYGGAETPVFGRQIAAFQGHHQRPWTITEREFCNNVHQVFKPAFAPASLFLLASPWTSPTWNAFISSFIFLVCMSQQFHAWSHMKKSELPGPVIALQDAGVLISRKMHGAHHRAPFEGNYCIVSGLWNPLLDSTLFFRTLERVIHERTGVEPRCWHDPEHGWEELQRPESTA